MAERAAEPFHIIEVIMALAVFKSLSNPCAFSLYMKGEQRVLSIGAKPYSHIRAAIFPAQLIAEGKNLIAQ